MRGRIQVGDVVTGPAGDTEWIVTAVRGPKIELMRDCTDSRGVNWIARREVPRRSVVVVGRQVELGL